MTPQGRILGIDYGEKRIGVAISDPMCIIAQGLPTIVYNTFSEALHNLEKIASEYSVCRIVVGLPLTMKGTAGFAVKRTRTFVQRLKERVPLPVVFLDERFSTTIAHRALTELGISPSKNRQKVDKIAATIILQDYLDRTKTLASDKGSHE
ncbi:MAG: Holliday junction resolvase RuvX [bacterium]